MSKIYIYALIDPRDESVRYIGKTNNLDARLKSHIERKKSNKDKIEWIKELGDKGLLPTIKVLEQVTQKNWVEKEKEWIAKGWANGWDLLNKTAGGEAGGSYPEKLPFMRKYLSADRYAEFMQLPRQKKESIILKAAQAGMVYFGKSIGLYEKDNQLWWCLRFRMEQDVEDYITSSF